MTYKVRIEVGKGKNKAITESIPLSRKRACVYIKRSPLVKSKTIVKITNLNTGEVNHGTPHKLCGRFK